MRIALGILGVLGAIFAPPWILLLIMSFLAFRYPAWEVLLIGLLIDLLWLPSGPLTQSLPLFTIVALVLVWGFEPLRSEFLISRR